MPASLNPNDDRQVLDVLTQTLASAEGRRAKDVSAALGLDKTIVNRLLYAHSDRFVQVGQMGQAPLWATRGPGVVEHRAR